ncbi:phage integrase [Pectobacterium carotovorum]|uniref:phage integrase n=1 Tax=Pectobacterium polonicum TaxID=2485124 RepID=UPI0023603B0B|nr:tyrosine-type recombinase/integrase [Pectobacterium polonicum]MDC9820939.1 tyrosine-type recombinase/integrase [Pectobacterium polonicum]
MSVRKLETGKWLCECYPNGRDKKRIRKTFPTKGEAVAYEQFIMNESASKPWIAEKKDNRNLQDLADLWFNLHGQSLSAGLMVYRKLSHIIKALGNPKAISFTANDFAHYRTKRLTGEIYLDKRFPYGATKTTLNMDHSHMHTMFSELSRLGEWKLPNPLATLRKFSTVEREMSWLDEDQVIELLELTAAEPDLNGVIRVCLTTGARWSEAQNLRKSQLSPHKITFTNTKSKKNRTVPIQKEFHNDLINIKSDRLFKNCHWQFLQAIKKSSIELPKGQMTHVLRHTFAAHFMMNGGNILVLQKILGHHDISMTMRYAHFAPDHLETALTYNPISKAINGGKLAA